MIPERVLSAISDAVYVFDADEVLVHANPVARDLLGCTVGSPLDQDVTGVLQELRAGTAEVQRQRWEGPPHALRCLSSRFGAVRNDAGEVELVVGVTRDVTLERLTQVRVSELQEIAVDLGRATSDEEVAEVVIGSVHALLGAAASVIYLRPAGSTTMRLVASRGGGEAAGDTRLEALLPNLPLSVAMRESRALWFERREDLLAAFPELQEGGTSVGPLEAMVALPVVIDGEVLGGIALCFPRPRPLDLPTREFMLAVASQCAQAAARIRHAQSRDRAQERLQVLADASRRFYAATLDLDAVLDAVCLEVAERVPEACGVLLIGEEGVLELNALRHIDPTVAAAARETLSARPARVGDDSVLGQVAATGRSAFLPRLPTTFVTRSSAEYREHLEKHPIASLMVVPLNARDRVIGVMIATRGVRRPVFSEDDLVLLTELADRAALSIQNARLFAEVAAERARSVAASRAKDEFLALLGHELRNPLAPILTALRLLRMKPSDSGRILDVLDRQASHLTRLVDDLLDISRITSRRLELRKQRVQVAAVAAQAAEQVRPLFDQRRIALRTHAPDDLAVDADPDRLTQMVANLLTNAAKFSLPETEVGLSASAAGDWVRIEVVDRGIGIDPGEVGRLFEPFAQGQNPRLVGDRGSGLGLGLAIVRNLAELHGGRVEVHSDGLGHGSRFVIELPAPQEALNPAPDPRMHPPDGPGRRLLVVDDNRDAADALALFLRDMGHEVEVAYDPVEALEVAARFGPEIALLDIALPVMDGIDLGKRLVEIPGLAGLQRIALTGYGRPSDLERSLAAGFVAHLVKPAEPERLLALLQSA